MIAEKPVWLQTDAVPSANVPAAGETRLAQHRPVTCQEQATPDASSIKEMIVNAGLQ